MRELAENVFLQLHKYAVKFIQICGIGVSTDETLSTSPSGSHRRRETVTHVPPENFSDINQPPTVEYDVYSFGVLLWEILAEEPPFIHGRFNYSYVAFITSTAATIGVVNKLALRTADIGNAVPPPPM